MVRGDLRFIIKSQMLLMELILFKLLIVCFFFSLLLIDMPSKKQLIDFHWILET